MTGLRVVRTTAARLNRVHGPLGCASSQSVQNALGDSDGARPRRPTHPCTLAPTAPPAILTAIAADDLSSITSVIIAASTIETRNIVAA